MSKKTKTDPAPEMTESEKRDAHLQEIGKNAMSAIAEMVAALECDYDRLEELKDERDDLESKVEDADTDSHRRDAKANLKEWDDEFGEELKSLEEAAGDCEDREEARQRIEEDPLSLEFRSGWVTDRTGDFEAEEFKLLLSTGGPAVQIIGEIGPDGPCHVRLQAQDWFTVWTDYRGQDTEVLEKYCRCFCFDL